MDEQVQENPTPEPVAPVESTPPPPPVPPRAPAENVVTYIPPKGWSGKKWLLIFILAIILIGTGFTSTSYFLSQQSSSVASAEPESLGSATPLAKTSNKKDAQRKEDLKNIGEALEDYYKKNGSYPAFKKEGYEWCDATRLKQDLVPDFLKEIPTDPTGKPYFIYLISDKGYLVAANLENTSDPDVTKEKLIRFDMGEIYGGEYTDIKFNVDSCPAGSSFNFWITTQ